MKKSILGIVLFSLSVLFSSNALFAGIGIKGGVGISGLNSATGDFRHFLGYEMSWLSMGNLRIFQVGVFQSFDISKNLKFQPELFYSLRGGEASADFLFGKVRYQVVIHYLELPLLAKVEIPIKGNFLASLLLGPYAALKLSAKKISDFWGEKETGNLPNVKSLDYGAIVGGGVEVPLGSGRWVVELRFSYGLNNMMAIPEDFIRLYEDQDFLRNFAGVIMTGYRF